jgi:hypothetical protein
MQVGDLVKSYMIPYNIGVVVSIDDSHRQTHANVLFSITDGTRLLEKIWVNQLEVISESR